MKKKFIYIILTIIVVALLVVSGIYVVYRSYFEGAVNTYINAQQIPAKKISERKVYFNWANDGQWEEFIKVNNYGHKLYL